MLFHHVPSQWRFDRVVRSQYMFNFLHGWWSFWRCRTDQHLLEESQLAMGFAEAPVILRAPSPRGTLREWRLWRCLHHMHPLTDPPRSTKFGLPGSEPPKMPLLSLCHSNLHNPGGSESLQAFDVPWAMTIE